MMIEGENLVVHRIPNGGVGEGEGRGEAVFPGKDEVGMYQNLDFKSKRSSGMIATTSNVYMEDTDGYVPYISYYVHVYTVYMHTKQAFFHAFVHTKHRNIFA